MELGRRDRLLDTLMISGETHARTSTRSGENHAQRSWVYDPQRLVEAGCELCGSNQMTIDGLGRKGLARASPGRVFLTTRAAASF